MDTGKDGASTIRPGGEACLAIKDDVKAGYCKRDWDEILCWPPSAPDTNVALPCMDELNGIKYYTSDNAFRMCHANGSWSDWVDYGGCKEIQPFPLPNYPSYATGYVLSLIAVVVALIIFIVYKKKLRDIRIKIHVNFLLAFLLSAGAWLITVPLRAVVDEALHTDSCPIAITVASLFMSYAYEATHFWLLVEALHHYLASSKSMTKGLKLKIYLIIGWGAPLINTIAWSGLKTLLVPDKKESMGIEDPVGMPHCILFKTDPVDWIYLAPALLIVVLGIFFVVSALVAKRPASDGEGKLLKYLSKALLVVVIVFTVDLLIGFIRVSGNDNDAMALAFKHIRALLEALKGIVVAVLICFVNPEVWMAVSGRVGGGGGEGGTGGTQEQTPPPQSTE